MLYFALILLTHVNFAVNSKDLVSMAEEVES